MVLMIFCWCGIVLLLVLLMLFWFRISFARLPFVECSLWQFSGGKPWSGKCAPRRNIHFRS